MTTSNQTEIAKLDRDMASRHMTPLWQLEGDIMAWTPRPISPWSSSGDASSRSRSSAARADSS